MHDNQEQADFWNSASGQKWVRFEEELNIVFDTVNQELIRRARPKPGEHVLDIGCGTGSTSRAFARQIAPTGSITAIDISAQMLKHAETRSAETPVKFQYYLLDAQQDAIPAAAPFDIATSRFGVMFFADPILAFKNIRRHLSKDGRLVFAAWAPLLGNPWFAIPRDAAISRLGPPESEEPNAPGPFGLQDICYTIEVLKQAGFTDVVGQTVDLTLTYPGPLQEVAGLASNIGPAARTLRQYHGNKEDVDAIWRIVLEGFRAFEKPSGIEIPARLNFFEATDLRRQSE